MGAHRSKFIDNLLQGRTPQVMQVLSAEIAAKKGLLKTDGHGIGLGKPAGTIAGILWRALKSKLRIWHLSGATPLFLQ